MLFGDFLVPYLRTTRFPICGTQVHGPVGEDERPATTSRPLLTDPTARSRTLPRRMLIPLRSPAICHPPWPTPFARPHKPSPEEPRLAPCLPPPAVPSPTRTSSPTVCRSRRSSGSKITHGRPTASVRAARRRRRPLWHRTRPRIPAPATRMNAGVVHMRYIWTVEGVPAGRAADAMCIE